LPDLQVERFVAGYGAALAAIYILMLLAVELDGFCCGTVALLCMQRVE
jgi:hypothetical protein